VDKCSAIAGKITEDVVVSVESSWIVFLWKCKNLLLASLLLCGMDCMIIKPYHQYAMPVQNECGGLVVVFVE